MSVGDFLTKLPTPIGNVVVVDTEGAGLFSDGRWSHKPGDCQPSNRVSTVSFSFDAVDGIEIHVAIPFDQGKIGGKPSVFNYDIDDYDTFSHKDECDSYYCRCEPMNFDDPHAWRQLMLWFSDKRLVFHNGKHDLHVLRDGLRKYPGTGFDFEDQFHWDTLLVQANTEPLESNKLGAIGERLFDEGKSDGMEAALKKLGTSLTKRYDLVDPATTLIYATQDTNLTKKLFHYQGKRIEAGEIDAVEIELIATDFKKMKLLYRMENRGVAYRGEEMREECKKMVKAIEELRTKLPWIEHGKEANISGARWWFFEKLNTPPVKLGNACTKCRYNKETGKRAPSKAEPCENNEHTYQPSVDGESVDRLVEQGVPGAWEWSQIVDLESAVNKWYRAWPHQVGKDGRLRTNYRQCKVESDRKDAKTGGAISMRLSAERVQFQGFPDERKIPQGIKSPKKMLSTKPDHELWELDVSNGEVRIVAKISGDRNLLAKVNSGENIHDANTKAIFNIEPDHPDWDRNRKIAKIEVFAHWYGSGVDTMVKQAQTALGITIPRSMITNFKRQLDAAYPSVARLFRAAQRKADVTMGGCGYIRLYTGRRRWFGWGERTHKALNQIMQCNLAEAVAEWMLAIEDKYPGILVNQVHDSVWLEIHKDVASSVVEDVQRMGVDILERAFSGVMFVVDSKRLA